MRCRGAAMAAFAATWAPVVLELERACHPDGSDVADALLSALAATETLPIDEDNVVQVFLTGLPHKLHAVIVATLRLETTDALDASGATSDDTAAATSDDAADGAAAASSDGADGASDGAAAAAPPLSWGWAGADVRRRAAQTAAVVALRRVVVAADALAEYHDGLLELQAHDVLETLERLVLGEWDDRSADRKPPTSELAEAALLMPRFRLFEELFAAAGLSEDGVYALSESARAAEGVLTDATTCYGEVGWGGAVPSETPSL